MGKSYEVLQKVPKGVLTGPALNSRKGIYDVYEYGIYTHKYNAVRYSRVSWTLTYGPAVPGSLQPMMTAILVLVVTDVNLSGILDTVALLSQDPCNL